jgi:outer membrane receptor protein involved in Fe transport
MTALLVLTLLCQAASDAVVPSGGILIDARSRSGIAGAELTLVGERIVARTDASGRFRWTTRPPPAPVTIIVILPDGRVARPIRLTEWLGADDLVLVAEAAIVEGVTISGIAPTIRSAPGASTALLPGTDLAMRAPATLAQALENVVGVSFISEGQGAVPAIRGLARGRSLILVDGGRVSTERRAGANASFLDPARIGSIEIARGPASVAYGSDAFGGVIAVHSRRAEYRTPLQARVSATVGAGIPQGSGAVELSRGYGSNAVLVSVRARAFGDYRAPAGVVPNSGWRDGGIAARWDHQASARSWSIDWQTGLDRQIGRPRSDAASIVATTPYEDSHRLTVSYESESVGFFKNVRFGGLFGSSRERTEQDRLATSRQPRNVTRADISSRDAQLRATGDHAFGRVLFQAGADFQGRYGLESVDTAIAYDLKGSIVSIQATPSIASAYRTGIGIFGQADAQLTPRLTLTAGLRGDAVRNTNAGGYFGDRRVTNSAAAGLFAATFVLTSRSTITAQIARGFRDPTLTDRFYRGPVGRGFIQGNPDLRAETSRQLDLTTRWDFRLVRLSGAYYDYRIANLVERYLIGTADFFFRNRGAGRLQGAEIEVQTAPSRGIVVDLSAQLSRGRDADTGTPLDDIAPQSISAGLRHSAGRWLDSYLRVAAIARHDAAGPSEVPTPGFVSIDSGAIWHWSSRVDVRGTVRNLLDRESYSSAGPRWVYAAGRNGSITLAVVF